MLSIGVIGCRVRIDMLMDSQILSAVFSENGRIYVRLYDVSGKEGPCTLTFPRNVKDAEYVNLNLEPACAASVSGRSVTLRCSAHKIITVAVTLE